MSDGVRVNMKLAVFACLAMAFGFAWFDIPGNCSAFAARDVQLTETILDGHTLYLFGMFLTVVVTAVWPYVFERHSTAAVVACMVLGTAANAVYCHATPMGIVAAAVVLMGLLDVLFINLTVAETLGHVADRRSQVVVTICALAFKTILAYLVDCLPCRELQMGFFVVLPLFGGAFALAALRQVTPFVRDVSSARLKFAFPLSVIMFGILLMSSVIFAATRVVSSLGFWGTGHVFALASPVTCVVLTVAFLLLCYVTLVKVDSRLLFQFMPALLVLFALYTFIYAGIGEYVGLSAETISLVSQYSELYGHAFVWSVILLAVRTLRMPALRVMGIQFSLFVVMELLLQRFLIVSGQGNLVVVLFVFFAAFALLVWALCHFDGRIDSSVEDTPTCREVDESPAFSAASQSGFRTSDCDARLAMAAAHGLTPRETDVFLLLAQGRSRRFICDELFIADGTASTYISRIYEKFGVRNKQELLTVVIEGDVQ